MVVSLRGEDSSSGKLVSAIERRHILSSVNGIFKKKKHNETSLTFLMSLSTSKTGRGCQAAKNILEMSPGVCFKKCDLATLN